MGVNRESTGTDTITMGCAIIPPAGRSGLHFHKNCDTAIYLVKGPINIYYKEGEEIRSREVPPGRFVYFPGGCVHGEESPDDPEVAELIFAYGGMPNEEAAGATFLDDPRGPLRGSAGPRPPLPGPFPLRPPSSPGTFPDSTAGTRTFPGKPRRDLRRLHCSLRSGFDG